MTVLGRDELDAQILARDLRSLGRGGALVRNGWLADARLRDPIVVLAVPYAGASAVLDYLRDQLAGRVVVDVTNPFRQPAGSPSGAEALARRLPPGAHLVKAFNTIFAANLLTGQAGGQALDVLIAGDDASAKASIAQLARDGGMHPLDVGPLDHARELEAMATLQLSIQKTHALGARSAWKLIRS